MPPRYRRRTATRVSRYSGMARKLKTFTTSAGFFDLAVAAPSMKAALEAWGAGANLFQQGFAQATDDPAIVKATTAKPGVVLRRPVGTTEPYREQADLPADLPAPAASKPKTKATPSPTAAVARRQEREERTLERERERRRTVIEAAEFALEKAREAHENRRASIDADRAAVEHRAQAEDERWREERQRLEAALHRVRAGSLRMA